MSVQFRRAASDRGSATAEFAIAMPAVLVVIAFALGGIQLAGLQLRLQDAAANAARQVARGAAVGSIPSHVGSPAAVQVQTWHDGLLECVRLTAAAGGAVGLLGVRVSASSCALGGGG